jgi:EAL domain-containing protein (putative c-di-GMP-specific phosphodiesterase class I)
LLAIEIHDAAALHRHLGLAAFDQVLAQIGAFIVGHARVGCMTARHGNAGYLIFAPTRSESELAALARELIESVREARFGAQATAVRLVCAVCAFEASIDEAAQALAAVERTLAAARARPGAIAIHSELEPDPDSVTQRLSVALAAEAFGLAFQPILPIHGAAEPLYQALLRLRTGEKELVAAELVPVAVRTGVIADVDAWVLRRCIAIIAERQRQGEPLRLFASQSLQGWSDNARFAGLHEALTDADLPAGSLVMEFRAEEVRHNMRVLVGLAEDLRRANVALSLAGVDADALAAGWIDHLPLDYVKLAPGLDDATLASIVDATHARGIKAIAPCVETRAEVERLRAGDIDLLQGNYFRPPADGLGEPMMQAES